MSDRISDSVLCHKKIYSCAYFQIFKYAELKHLIDATDGIFECQENSPTVTILKSPDPCNSHYGSKSIDSEMAISV